MKGLAILGSTGSIGVTTLDVVGRFPDRFRVEALAAGRKVALLAEQAELFRPRLVSLADASAAREFRERLPSFEGEVLHGPAGLEAVATAEGASLVVSALVGAVGLLPTLRAIEAGRDVALANKEVLVVAGELVTTKARQHGVSLLPLDSEHNAIFQVLAGHRREDVRRLVLTASGGPFLRRAAEDLFRVTREDALRHPTWNMGEKITIDSASLMNKGLEVIEAHWLFGLPADQIDVLVHPQSIVHSMVEYVDGSVLAQMGVPDMAIPISFVLAYPERLPMGHLPRLDLVRAARLEFESPDRTRFPCLGLAYRALQEGGTVPAVLNAANEVAVEAFLAGRIGFMGLPQLVERVLDRHAPLPAQDLETLLHADDWARSEAEAVLLAEAGEASAGALLYSSGSGW